MIFINTYKANDFTIYWDDILTFTWCYLFHKVEDDYGSPKPLHNIDSEILYLISVSTDECADVHSYTYTYPFIHNTHI